ncbi:MAG: nucleotidyl transferase AbiEii/AbiGii toxin family protein [Lachnospiraceae bacterium]|nr:nucleotidyl transferase AbiEii/AbiGii toxin family protein [Lachnospiraceae bacterium]
MLHEDKNDFRNLIIATATRSGMQMAVVEKDYYVTLILGEIAKRNPSILFKGGTSLSKCYKIIDRFSEDIDLNLIGDSRPTEGQRRALKHDITDAIEAVGLTLTNRNQIRSKRDFNRYRIDYNPEFPSSALKTQVIIETAVFLRAYPYNRMRVNSYIQDFLESDGKDDLVDELALPSFEVNVQSLERTLIDKCFALADYYITKRVEGHSRHIYDIYKIVNHIRLDSSLKKLAESVRIERREDSECPSASDDIDLNQILQKIIEQQVYKQDYNDITEAILFQDKDLKYSDAIKGLQAVIDSGVFFR